MSITNKKPLRPVGVGAMYYCGITAIADDGTMTFKPDVVRLRTVSQIQTTESRSVTPVYASNSIYDEETNTAPPLLAIQHVAFPAEILAEMRGNKVTGGFIMHSTFDQGAYFAIGIVYPKRDGKADYVWYPKCLLVDANHSAQTSNESGSNAQDRTLNIQTYEFETEDHLYQTEYDSELIGSGVTAITEEAYFAAPLLAPLPVT